MSEDVFTKKTKKSSKNKTLPYPEEWLLNAKEKDALTTESNKAVDVFTALYEKKKDS